MLLYFFASRHKDLQRTVRRLEGETSAQRQEIAELKVQMGFIATCSVPSIVIVQGHQTVQAENTMARP